jgi:Uma2 family endonuclease
MNGPERFSRLTEEEYLALEEASPVRHEYVDGYVFAMSGASQAHQLIVMNISAFLHAKLSGKPCRAVSAGLRLRVSSTHSYYYPDVMVDCTPFVAEELCATKPTLIVEVLSPSTAATDRREKLLAYQTIPSLNEYLIVYQNRQQAELHRKDASGAWSYFVLRFGDELILESLPGGPTQLSFATIYDGYDPPTVVKECEEPEYEWA